MASPEYWTWWQSGAALATVALFYFWGQRTTFGVSSLYSKLADWSNQREAAEAETVMASMSTDEVNAAMEAEMAAILAQRDSGIGAAVSAAPQNTDRDPEPESPVPFRVPANLHPSVHLTFLAAIAIGGAVAALVTGHWQASLDVSESYARHVVSSPDAWGVLFGGGVLVGLGTHMAGGCTAGHGLNGCASLQSGSFASTTAFFVAACMVSLFLVGAS